MLNAKEAAELNAREEKEDVQLPNSIKRILLALEMEIRKRIVFHNDYKLWITYNKNAFPRERFNETSTFDWMGSKVCTRAGYFPSENYGLCNPCD